MSRLRGLDSLKKSPLPKSSSNDHPRKVDTKKSFWEKYDEKKKNRAKDMLKRKTLVHKESVKIDSCSKDNSGSGNLLPKSIEDPARVAGIKVQISRQYRLKKANSLKEACIMAFLNPSTHNIRADFEFIKGSKPLPSADARHQFVTGVLLRLSELEQDISNLQYVNEQEIQNERESIYDSCAATEELVASLHIVIKQFSPLNANLLTRSILQEKDLCLKKTLGDEKSCFQIEVLSVNDSNQWYTLYPDLSQTTLITGSSKFI